LTGALNVLGGLSPPSPTSKAGSQQASKTGSKTDSRPGTVGAPPPVSGTVMSSMRPSLGGGQGSRHSNLNARVHCATPGLSKSNSLGNFLAAPPTARPTGRPQRGAGLCSEGGTPSLSTASSMSALPLAGTETSYASSSFLFGSFPASEKSGHNSRGHSPSRTVYVGSANRTQIPVPTANRTSPRDASAKHAATSSTFDAGSSRRRPAEIRGASITGYGSVKAASILADPSVVHLSRNRNGQVRSQSPLAARSSSPLRPTSRRILVSSSTLGGTPRLSVDSWSGNARLPTPEPRGKVATFSDAVQNPHAPRGLQAGHRPYAYSAEVVSAPMPVPSRSMEP